MIIRSQNKRIITTDLNLHIEPRDSRAIGNVTCWIKNETMGILATYSSWEKAIKVLDMICNFADDKHYEKVASTQCGCIGGIVFNMPSDESVEV